MSQEKEIARMELAIEDGKIEASERNLKACADIMIYQKELWKTMKPQLIEIDKNFVVEASQLARKLMNEYSSARTEMGLADAFAKEKTLDVKYCATFQSGWAYWGIHGWTEDEDNMVLSWIKGHIKSIANGEPKLEKSSVLNSVAKLLTIDRSIVTRPEQWDSDKFLLGTPGGVINLKDGTISKNNRGLLISKKTSVEPSKDEDCPKWKKFLVDTTGADESMIAYLQRVAGYCLTGSIEEHALFFAYGEGGNGKSVFIETLGGVMGNYWNTAQMDTFVAKNYENHTTELAGLRGSRMVTAVETEEGRRWAEAKIKQMTGGDSIKARFMRQDDFTFRPEFKLLIAGNHAPSLSSVDKAIRRRFHILPFNQTPLKIDKSLVEKLKSEWPGILRWMINGAIMWSKVGLVRPEAVENATNDYFEEQNTFLEWFEETYKVSEDVEDRVEKKEAYSSMASFYENYSLKPLNRTAFGKKIKGVFGIGDKKAGGVRYYTNIRKLEKGQV